MMRHALDTFVAEWRLSFRRYRFVPMLLLGLNVALGAFCLWLTFTGAARGYASWAFFQTIAGAHFVFVAMIGPVLGSAAVVEERRNRSAGLLILTDLSRWDIVLAKFASRAAMLLLIFVISAVLPALAASVAFTNVGHLARLMAIAAMAGVGGLAIGLCCSMLAMRASQATIFGYFAALLMFVILPAAAQLLWLETTVPKAPPLWLDAWSPLFAFHHELTGFWPVMATARCCSSVGVGLLMTVVLVLISAWLWTPARLQAWELAELTPLGAIASENKTRLHQIRPTRLLVGRFGPAAACGFFLVMFLGIVVVERPNMTWEQLALGMSGIFFPVSWFLINLGLALYGARAFAEEKENGTLELLATTPLSNAALVWNKTASLLRRVGLVPAALVACQLALWLPGGEPPVTDVRSVMMLGGTPLAVGTRVIHFYLVIIGALWLSARCRTLTRSTLTVLVAFLGLILVSSAVSDWILGLGGLRAALTSPGGRWAGGVLAVASLLWRLTVAIILHLSLTNKLRVFATRQ